MAAKLAAFPAFPQAPFGFSVSVILPVFTFLSLGKSLPDFVLAKTTFPDLRNSFPFFDAVTNISVLEPFKHRELTAIETPSP